MSIADRRTSTSSDHSATSKFPDFETSPREHLTIYGEGPGHYGDQRRSPTSPGGWARSNASLHSDRWQPRKESEYARTNGTAMGAVGRGHTRQKSLSDAIRIIRGRQGSVVADAQEIAQALKAPVSFKLTALCIAWYLSSALTNTSSKSILNAFPKPVTLTVVQFMFVSFWCIISAGVAHVYPPVRTAIPALKYGIRYPSKEVVRTTLPLAFFQLGGHILSSTATARIPVSLVHTIKGLSPLFTVLAYRFIFRVHYSAATYLSLVPLTVGVVLACSVEFGGNLWGIACAFVAAMIFVTQNIFSKKLFNEASRAESDGGYGARRKLDKLNLLCYCSGLAFLLTAPIWFWAEGLGIMQDFYADGSVDLSEKPLAFDHGRLALEFLFNGIFHFGQNIMAFILLSLVSPVTYSVASLIKRVFVIVAAIVWFGNPTTKVQAAGVALTFLGLYLYDRTSDAAKADRRAAVQQSRQAPLLPLVTNPRPSMQASEMGTIYETPVQAPEESFFANGHTIGTEKKDDAAGPGRIRSASQTRDQWLPPGTKQEDTWRAQDVRTAA